MEDSEVVFDRVLHSVGDDGKFQKRFNYIFNYSLAAISTLVYMNIILALNVPNHWCYVPGREEANLTIEEWKEKNLPKINNSFGQEAYSSCKMYAQLNNIDPERTFENSSDGLEIEDCRYGYEYDTTWYSSTASSSQDWVCDKNLYPTNAIAAAKLGEVFGCLLMGYLGDIYGRKFVYYVSLVLMLIPRLINCFVSQWYYVFTAMSVLATFTSTSVSQSCMVTIMEISPSEDRAFLAQMQNLGWTTGVCILPLIYWALDDWYIFLLVTTVPLGLYIFLSIYIIESPRWLLTKGRVSECLKVLEKIAKVNGTTLSPNSALLLQNSTVTPEKTYGIGSLFSQWRLAKNTSLVLTTMITCLVCYYTIVLNASYMSGNPHLNFFLQSIAEAPSFIVGRYLCDRIGRRSTGIIANTLAVIGYISLTTTITYQDFEWFHIAMIMLAKFSSSLLFFTVSLQGLEIYPTCVRQGGNSLSITAGTVFGTLSPYIVHLGVTVDARLPYLILMTISIIAIVAEILLPETLNEHLPETLQEAKQFGKNQKYFSFPSKKKDNFVFADVKYLRTQISEKHKNDDHE